MEYDAKTLKRAMKRVDKGARLLDRKDPGWWEAIDLNILEIEHSCKCILGQWSELNITGPGMGENEYPGDYTDGIDLLLGDYDEAQDYGFDVFESGYDYDLLTELWVGEIIFREKHAEFYV